MWGKFQLAALTHEKTIALREKLAIQAVLLTCFG